MKKYFITSTLILITSISYGQTAKSAASKKMKTIYGQTMTKEEWNESADSLSKQWIPGDAGIKDRIARFQKEKPNFQDYTPAEIKPEVLKKIIDGAKTFHLENCNVKIEYPQGLLNFDTVFHLTAVDIKGKDGGYKGKDKIEGKSSSTSISGIPRAKGKTLQLEMINFELPIEASDSAVKSGTATITLTVPGKAMKTSLTKEKPKALDYELVSISPQSVQIKKSTGTPGKYIEILSKGKVIESFEVTGGDMALFYDLAKAKKWEEIPDQVPMPAQINFIYATRVQADEVRLIDVKSDVHTIKSTWKAFQ